MPNFVNQYGFKKDDYVVYVLCHEQGTAWFEGIGTLRLSYESDEVIVNEDSKTPQITKRIYAYLKRGFTCIIEPQEVQGLVEMIPEDIRPVNKGRELMIQPPHPSWLELEKHINAFKDFDLSSSWPDPFTENENAFQ